MSKYLSEKSLSKDAISPYIFFKTATLTIWVLFRSLSGLNIRFMPFHTLLYIMYHSKRWYEQRPWFSEILILNMKVLWHDLYVNRSILIRCELNTAVYTDCTVCYLDSHFRHFRAWLFNSCPSIYICKWDISSTYSYFVRPDIFKNI